MKRWIAACFLFAFTAFGQSTLTTYTGTVKDLAQTTVTSGRITWTLNPPTESAISGIGAFTQTTVSCLISSAGHPVATSDGTSPCVITNNMALTPTGTSYRMCIQPYNVTPGSCIVTYALGGTVDISTVVPTPSTQPNYGFANVPVAISQGGTGATTATDALGTLGIPSYSVLNFGATGDGATDDTLAVQTAINAAAAVGIPKNGGTVYLPSGIYVVTGLTIPSFVTLVGDGPGITVIRLKNGTTGQIITIPSKTSYLFGLRGMTLDCNSSNGTTGSGIVIQDSGTGGGAQHHVGDKYQMTTAEAANNGYIDGRFSNFIVTGCSADGINDGYRDYQLDFSHFWTIGNNGNGINLQNSNNQSFSDFHAESNGISGIASSGGNNRFINGEINWNGWLDAASKGQVSDVGSRNIFTNLHIEDGFTDAVYVGGLNSIFTNIVADRNGYTRCVPANVWCYQQNASTRTNAAFRIAGTGNWIDGEVVDYAGVLPDGYYATEWAYIFANSNLQANVHIFVAPNSTNTAVTASGKQLYYSPALQIYDNRLRMNGPGDAIIDFWKGGVTRGQWGTANTGDVQYTDNVHSLTREAFLLSGENSYQTGVAGQVFRWKNAAGATTMTLDDSGVLSVLNASGVVMGSIDSSKSGTPGNEGGSFYGVRSYSPANTSVFGTWTAQDLGAGAGRVMFDCGVVAAHNCDFSFGRNTSGGSVSLTGYKGDGTSTSLWTISTAGLADFKGGVTTPSLAINAGTAMTGSVGTGGLAQETTSAAKTSGNCVKFDANGNTVDAGAPCGGGSWPVAPQVEWWAYNSSGTTLTDSSGNGYNGTFASSPNAPSFTSDGTAVWFRPSAVNDQWISVPYQALQGLQSVIVFYQPQFPSTNATSTFYGRQYLLSDCAKYGAALTPSRFGQIGLVNGTNAIDADTPTDRLTGNVAIGFNIPTSGNLTAYPYGRNATSYLFQTSLATFFTCSSGVGEIGAAPGYAHSGFSGKLYGVVGFSALTNAQMNQSVAHGISLLNAHGVSEFNDQVAPYRLIYDGDSRMQFYSANYLLGSRPWEIGQLGSDRAQFYNFGIAGQTLSTINAGFSTVKAPLIQKYSTGSTLVQLDAITNDIHANGCTTGAGCFAYIQTYGANVQAARMGTPSVYSTSTPGNSLSSAQETVREDTNALVSSNALAGTFNFTAVDDIANDPIASTAVFPNNYAPTGLTPIAVSSVVQVGPPLTDTLTLASAAPLEFCYPGAEWTIAGMTPTGFNGTFALGQGGNTYAYACNGNTITYAGSGYPTATVLGTATPTGGSAISVLTGASVSGSKATTFTLASAPPAWQCHPGAVWKFAGNTPTQLNGTFTLTSCSGADLTTLGPVATSALSAAGTAVYSYDGSWLFDGTHENGRLNKEMAPRESAAQLSAQGRLKSCTSVTMTIPWTVLGATQATTSALTQMIPILQLWPGQHVCSVSANVQTAFAGGFSALTMSIGDSNGTATQYSAAGDAMATGQIVPPNMNPAIPTTPNGMVQLNFTATTANIDTVTAGNMTVSIGIIEP